MPEQPNPIGQENPLQSLATRYGMTTSDIEDILRGTNEEYRKPAPSNSIETISTPTATAPESALPPSAVSSVKAAGFDEELHRSRPLSGGFMIALYTVLLIVLGIAFSFRRGCFEQRAERAASKPIDTIQNLLNQQTAKASTPPVTPADVTPDQLPPEAVEIPRETPPPSPHTKAVRKQEHTAPVTSIRPVLETSSSYEAEEQLAELKADGQSKAHISKVTKNGATRYRLFAK